MRALVVALALAAGGCAFYKAHAPRQEQLVEVHTEGQTGGVTSGAINFDSRDALVLRPDPADVPPFRRAAFVDKSGTTLAWQDLDGTLHVARGVTAEQIAAAVFEYVEGLLKILSAVR